MKYKILLVAFFVSFRVVSQYKGESKVLEFKDHTLIIEKSLPPLLLASDVSFVDANNNNRIDANESCNIQFKISNQGKGTARSLSAQIRNLNSAVTGLNFTEKIDLGNIAPNSFQNYTLPVNGTMDLTSGDANFEITFIEKTGLPPDPIAIHITTKAFSSPKIQVVDYSFLSDYGQISLGKPLQLKALIQNTGQGIGENIKVTFNYPTNIVANGDEKFDIGTLQAGETRELLFDFIATKNYFSPSLSITITIQEKYGRFADNKDANVAINAKSSGTTTVNITSNQQDKRIDIVTASLTSDIDKNIPILDTKNPNKFALIIGNEDYTSRQMGLSVESNVAFAINDAKTFKQYCVNTFGILEENVHFLMNATAGEMGQKINLITQLLSRMNGKGELIFYYAGHGQPDEVTKIPYLVPVDVNATNLTNAINLFDLYAKISTATPYKATFFLDACFTGGGRDVGLLTARAVKIKPKNQTVSGNLVVFSATSDEQSALPYKAKQHGMFTYYLLKEVQQNKGVLNYEQLFINSSLNIGVESLKVNQKTQDPQVLYGYEVSESWKTWKINE
jgi:hypothetical protein